MVTNPVRSYLRRHLNWAPEADEDIKDVVQEVYHKICVMATSNTAPIGNPWGYFRVVFVHECNRWFHKYGKLIPLGDAVEDLPVEPHPIEVPLTMMDILITIGQLDAPCQNLLREYYGSDFTCRKHTDEDYSRIKQALGHPVTMSDDALRQRVSRCVQDLRTKLRTSSSAEE